MNDLQLLSSGELLVSRERPQDESNFRGFGWKWNVDAENVNSLDEGEFKKDCRIFAKNYEDTDEAAVIVRVKWEGRH